MRDDDRPPDEPPRRPTQPLPVHVPLPTEEEEMQELDVRLGEARQRLRLLSAQVRLIQRAEGVTYGR